MRKLVALAAALVLVFALSARPANAQSIITPPVVVDRTAFVLTYQPIISAGASATNTTFAVSYQFGREWDALLSNTSGPTPATTGFRIGGRYHLRSPSPTIDVYTTVIYVSPSGGGAGSFFSVGAGLTDTLATGLRSYAVLTYDFLPTTVAPGVATITANIGVQYELSRQLAFVAGYEISTVGTGGSNGYLGLSYAFAAR